LLTGIKAHLNYSETYQALLSQNLEETCSVDWLACYRVLGAN